MTTPLHADLLAVLDAVEVHSPTRYTLRGEGRECPAAEPGEGPFVAALEADLYGSLYTRPTRATPAAATEPLARRDFVAALSAANSGRGTWEPGWTIRRVEADGRVAVSKDDLTFWVAPAGLRARGEAIGPGVACRVWVAKELRSLIPGYYVAIGDGRMDDEGDDGGPLVRYYWHLTPTAAVPFLAAATADLNAAGVPFRAKVLADPAGYLRADAGVLYLRRCHLGPAGAAIARIYAAVASGLRAAVPLFTKPLAAGLGLAEDPSGGLSFGQHRCRLSAQGLWHAFDRGEVHRSGRAATLASTFARAGLDPRLPHLEPGSADDYLLEPSRP